MVEAVDNRVAVAVEGLSGALNGAGVEVGREGVVDRSIRSAQCCDGFRGLSDGASLEVGDGIAGQCPKEIGRIDEAGECSSGIEEAWGLAGGRADASETFHCGEAYPWNRRQLVAIY